MRGMLDSLEKERQAGEWLFTFGVLYPHSVEEVDVYAERVGQARLMVRSYAERELVAGWSDIVLMEPGGTVGLAQF